MPFVILKVDDLFPPSLTQPSCSSYINISTLITTAGRPLAISFLKEFAEQTLVEGFAAIQKSGIHSSSSPHEVVGNLHHNPGALRC